MSRARCYDHPSLDAVARCSEQGCGKYICEDCYNTWEPAAGTWEGTALCYGCATALIYHNAADVSKFKRTVMREYIIIGIGAIIGLIFGLNSNYGIVGVWIGLGVGANMPVIGYRFMLAYKGTREKDLWNVAIAAGWGLIGILLGPLVPVYKIWIRVQQTIRLENIVIEEEETLRFMRDYYEYTIVIEGADNSDDFEELTSMGGVLFNNTFARSVIRKGEDAAHLRLRKGVVRIAANGEIIRRVA